MTTPETRTISPSNIFGTGLLLFGATLCYLRAETAVQHATALFPSYGPDALGMLPATGLAGARALQNLTLDPASALSAFLYFLLSCWPVAILFLGAALLRKSLFATLTPQTSLSSSTAASRGVRE